MRPLTVLLLSGAGAASLCASGCFGPMYNPNGAWGTPGYSQYNYPMNGYPGSIQTLTPGPQYVPGGSSIPGSSFPGSSVQPTPTYGGGSNNTVPPPHDPGSPYYVNPNDQYRLPGSGANAAPLNDAPPFSSLKEPFPEERLSAAAPATGSGPMLRPVAHVRGVNPSSPEAYNHDSAGYAWLEGVVSYDAADRTWNIVYNLDPGAEDKYAGHFTLEETPLMRTFREGERVRLEGRIDPVSKDRFGKPTYLPERVIRTAA